ncbi:MAG: hypothetical protein PHQ57_04575 [Candidatus Omnitrophica bacterium]|nr:hypothetical protein [Candidatus Omnitrophota bacterium]
MDNTKTRSLRNIEEKMKGMDEGSLRFHVLESAKNFKTSWVELGRSLYSVWRDKLYKEWGFNNFDTYASREIGIRKQTAMKLLRSYSFLEREEPGYLKENLAESADVASLPGYESIDVLRLAKNKKTLSDGDYVHLKKEIFEKGKDVREVKRDLTALMRQREELDPEEAREKRKLSTVKRFLSALKSLKNEIESSKLLPAPLIREVQNLISKLEAEVL